jgi:hypothetical protein
LGWDAVCFALFLGLGRGRSDVEKYICILAISDRYSYNSGFFLCWRCDGRCESSETSDGMIRLGSRTKK